MMESSSLRDQLVDGSDLSVQRVSNSSPPQLGVRTLKPVHSQPFKPIRSNSDVCLEDIESNSGEIFLNDEILASNSPQRKGDKDLNLELGSSTFALTGFSSEFAKFLKNSSVESGDSNCDTGFVIKKCSVRLLHLDIDVSAHLSMESRTSPPPSIDFSRGREAGKRDNDTVSSEAPLNKRPRSADVIILDAETPVKSSPEISVVKLTKGSPKENISSSLEKKSSESKPKSDKSLLFKPISLDGGRKPELNVSKPSKSLSTNSKLDNSDRTSLLSLEARLLDLQQKHQQKSKSNENHTKIKSMSPSGIKTNKDNHHRRTEAFVLERKKSVSSPVKKVVKKPYSAPTTPRENKLGGLFCPTTDAKVTILPCKTGQKDGELRPVATGSSSVTITKVSSGDSLSVSSKDIKKVFSPKHESKIKLPSGVSLKHEKTSPKSTSKERPKSGDKLEKVYKEHRHKDKEHRSKDPSKDGRERGERRERVGSLKIIRCSKCRDVFSTKEAKKLHTCNSILDAHYLIDGGDRQKTSPVSSTSTSDRSESTSASLSRSSSRSSSPGLTVSSIRKSGDSPKPPKIVKRLDDDKVAKVKISLAKVKQDDDDRNREKKFDKSLVKKDPMREKWIETKVSGKLERSEVESSLDDPLKNRPQGLIIEAIQSSSGMGGSSVEALRLDSKEGKSKEDLFSGDPTLFSFSGKRTYSPSMSESTQVDGKESPRETNSKDSPASQADSGVFSIASSASPSKVDGGINTDVRSPDSPRNMDNALAKSDHGQWRLGLGVYVSSSSHETKPSASLNSLRHGPMPSKIEGSGNGFPQGISLPVNTSITRVLPAGINYNLHSSSLNSHHAQIHPSYYLDEISKKKRGRPRKNGDPIFSGKFKNPKPKMSDDDKDMYDFEMEEDETKPMQPLRPRRQNAQPVTYKDPDSDEDAKARQSQVPLIQATQGYKDVHEKALTLNTSAEYGESYDDPSDNLGEDPDADLEGDEKDKNISYKCSTIEETPTGGIKLKIKIKKSASPVPLDPEPPLKKSKLDCSEESEEYTKPDPSVINEMQGMTAIQIKSELPTEKYPNHETAQTAPASQVIKPLAMMTPGLAGGMPPKHPTPPHTSQNSIPAGLFGSNNNPASSFPPVSTSSDEMLNGQGPPKVQNPYAIQKQNFPIGGNPNPHQSGGNPPQPGIPISNPSYSHLTGGNPHQPGGNPHQPGGNPHQPGGNPHQPGGNPHQPGGNPQQSGGNPHQTSANPHQTGSNPHQPGINPHQPNFEMQQNFPPGGYGDFTNYNVPYSNYMEQQQGQMYPGNQFQQHMAAYRPGMRPVSPMMPRQQQQAPGFMQNRLLEPRFPHLQSQMSDQETLHGGINSHLGGMNMVMGMSSHMGPGMPRHPTMMGSMMPSMTASNMPIGSYPSATMSVHSAMNQKPMTATMGPGGVVKGPMMNSPVMSPISGHGGMLPRSMSPHSMGVPERQLIGPPSMSPQSMSGSERAPMFPSNQYRLSSPQYSPAHQSQPSYGHSPTYQGSQGYPPPNTTHMYKPPTPQTYPKPPTPQSYPKPPTPQSYPKPATPQNPNTPGSYLNPSTPGAYQNPTTPGSHQNPLTPQPYDPQTPQSSLHNTSFESPTTQPVIQQNPQAVSNSFIVPKTESVIQSPVHNVFASKTAVPMLSPPSTTSSLRKIRRPSKSVTPGTVSPNQKTLSPNQTQTTVKSENDALIVPKLEPPGSPPAVPIQSEPISQVKTEPSISPKREIKQEPVEEEEPRALSPPPVVKTPEPAKEPRWGEDGSEGMPERALELIFKYVCYTEGCLPFLPNAMRVCKLWNRVANLPNLWTHANLGTAVKEKLRTEKKLEWILKNKFPNAVQVDVTSWKAVMSTPALKIIAANCPKLRGLGLSNCVKLNYEDIRIVPSLFPHLERIDLSLVSPSTASSRSAVSSSALSDLITALGDKLTHFNMSSNKMAGLPFVFKALSQHSKNLTLLDVSNISTTSRDTILINIEKLQKGCPKLTTFRTTNTMLGLNEVPVREQVAAPGFPCLEELTIGVDQRGYFDGMDDGQIERILKKSNKLRLLDIRGCKGISDSTLVRLPCWDIEYLYVAGCSVTSSSRDGLELLVKKWCATLIELDIGLTSDARTVDWAVMALVEHEGILRLRKLNLNGTGVNLKPLTKLLNCCRTLESLNLSSCRALPRGMKRMYHSKEDVNSLRKDIAEGKFDARDAGSEEDD